MFLLARFSELISREWLQLRSCVALIHSHSLTFSLSPTLSFHSFTAQSLDSKLFFHLSSTKRCGKGQGRCIIEMTKKYYFARSSLCVLACRPTAQCLMGINECAGSIKIGLRTRHWSILKVSNLRFSSRSLLWVTSFIIYFVSGSLITPLVSIFVLVQLHSFHKKHLINDRFYGRTETRRPQ